MTEIRVPSLETPADQPLVVVAVGTDYHRFDRLVDAADAWAQSNPETRVVVQYGTSPAPIHAEGYELIAYDRLCALFNAADVVVCHGGPSTVMDARGEGTIPIVLPRHPDYGEHVDFHQVIFAQHLRSQGLAHTIDQADELAPAIARALSHPDEYVAATDSGELPGVKQFSHIADQVLAGGQAQGPVPADVARQALAQLADLSHLDDQAVSVVIATRDRPELLRRALDSVLGQDHLDPIEVVLVYDRSEPDYSLASDDPQRRVVVTTNQRSPGLAGARNSGISLASHPWIALCDDDDEWLDGKLTAQFEALRRLPAARAACTGIYIRYEGSDTARIPDPAKVTFDGFLQDRMTEVHPSAWLVHKETLLDEVGLVDEDLPGSYAEDYDMFLRTTRSGPLAVAEEPLVRVWWHGASFFFERWKTIDDALGYLMDKYPEFHDHPRGAARIYGQRAVAQAAMGQRTRAVRTAWETARLNPTEKRVPLALAIAAGLPAGMALKAAHRVGRGI